MLDGLLGSKFSNKCKSKLKCIKLRIGPLCAKKQAVVRIQKKDVADLLASGHQENAFGRIDALSTDMNIVRCYEMIEQSCDLIESHISILQKQRELPDEVAEAMSNLIYAAARFPDLPELCDLRNIFIERYGNGIESYVNSEFMKKAQKRHLSKEEKLQIMQNVANEFSIRWNLKEFDKKLPRPPVVNHCPKPVLTKNEEPMPVLGILKRGVQSMLKGRPDTPSVLNRHQVQVQNDIHVLSSVGKEHSTDPAQHVMPGRMKTTVPSSMKTINENSTVNCDNLEDEFLRSRTSNVNDESGNTGYKNRMHILKSSSSDKPVNLVRPYTKPDMPRNGNHAEETSDHEIGAPYFRPNYHVENGNRRAGEQVKLVHSKGSTKNMLPPYVKPNPKDHIAQSNPNGQRNNLQSKERTIAKESRATNECENDNGIYYGKLFSRISSEQRRHGRFRSATAHEEGYDEDEIIIDKLLAHYSRKGTTPEHRPTVDKDVYADGVADKDNDRVRTSSVPQESVKKITKRATSLQADTYGSQVHAGIPDFDQLAARVAAMRKIFM